MLDVVTWEDPVIGLQVEPFNWRLRRARKARGWSRAALARAAGISQGTVGDAERLRRVPAVSREKMALTLEIPEDELFPGVIDDLPKQGPGTIEIPFTEEQIERWHGSRSLPEASGDLGALVEQEELHDALSAALDTLKPRERRVIEARYGLDDGTAKDMATTGALFGISRERIRQIEADALRKLRHPWRANYLQAWRDDWPTPGTLPRRIPADAPRPMRVPAQPFLLWLREKAEDEEALDYVRGIAGVVLTDDCFKGPWQPDALRAHIAGVHCNEAGFWPVYDDFIRQYVRWSAEPRRVAGGA